MSARAKTAINATLLLAAPTPEQVARSRLQSGVTQAAMASALGLSSPGRIAEYESGIRQMPATSWSLWLLMCGQRAGG